VKASISSGNTVTYRQDDLRKTKVTLPPVSQEQLSNSPFEPASRAVVPQTTEVFVPNGAVPNAVVAPSAPARVIPTVLNASIAGLNDPQSDGGLTLALACAEGNTNLDGTNRFLGVSASIPTGYPTEGHVDPGDNNFNYGRLSYSPERHGRSDMSIAECEQAAVELVNQKMATLQIKLKEFGLSPSNKNYRFVLAVLMDSVNQTGDACFQGRYGLFTLMPKAIERLNAGENPLTVMTEVRIQSHSNDDGSCGSFGGSWKDTKADQQRRLGEIFNVMTKYSGFEL
jgi:hypothetical protein